MNANFPIHRLLTWLAALAFLTPALHAQNATQTIDLVAGWNAVWLEVEPQDATGQPLAPTAVFNTAGNGGIAIIASPKPLAGLAEFFGDDPTSESSTFNQDGWEHWRRSDPSNASNLVMTTGNRAYLIHCTADVPPFAITGKARFFRPKWTPDRYNLVGFGIDGTVTFTDFFANATTSHPLGKIYTLGTGGAWTVVTPGSNIIDGKAYWIFSKSPSNFMGPVAVDFDNSITGKLNFGGPEDAEQIYGPAPGTAVVGSYDIEEVVLTNRRTTGATPSLTRLVDDAVVLTETTPDADSLKKRKGNDVGAEYTGSDEVPGGTTRILSLGASASRQWTLPAERTNLYRLKTGGGNAVYLPVSARNSSLPALPNVAPTASTSVGLWVGEASMNAVTSIVENGEPVRPSSGSAPVRIILHSDAAGAVRLLSQVTVMQTKTADPTIEPSPVLVVDPAQIPFFEGIKERNGKRVGQRIESVAYDMPRDIDANSLATLIAASARPPSLEEIYHFSWPLTGEIGSGKSVTTTTPLNLDPFHRSNPFRHAFHKEHVRGPNITRTITIVFDPGQPVTGRLTGTITDTLQGLTTTDLTLTGRIEMRRLSTVATLEGTP